MTVYKFIVCALLLSSVQVQAQFGDSKSLVEPLKWITDGANLVSGLFGLNLKKPSVEKEQTSDGDVLEPAVNSLSVSSSADYNDAVKDAMSIAGKILPGAVQSIQSAFGVPAPNSETLSSLGIQQPTPANLQSNTPRKKATQNLVRTVNDYDDEYSYNTYSQGSPQNYQTFDDTPQFSTGPGKNAQSAWNSPPRQNRRQAAVEPAQSWTQNENQDRDYPQRSGVPQDYPQQEWQPPRARKSPPRRISQLPPRRQRTINPQSFGGRRLPSDILSSGGLPSPQSSPRNRQRSPQRVPEPRIQRVPEPRIQRVPEQRRQRAPERPQTVSPSNRGQSEKSNEIKKFAESLAAATSQQIEDFAVKNGYNIQTLYQIQDKILSGRFDTALGAATIAAIPDFDPPASSDIISTPNVEYSQSQTGRTQNFRQTTRPRSQVLNDRESKYYNPGPVQNNNRAPRPYPGARAGPTGPFGGNRGPRQGPQGRGSYTQGRQYPGRTPYQGRRPGPGGPYPRQGQRVQGQRGQFQGRPAGYNQRPQQRQGPGYRRGPQQQRYPPPNRAPQPKPKKNKLSPIERVAGKWDPKILKQILAYDTPYVRSSLKLFSTDMIAGYLSKFNISEDQVKEFKKFILSGEGSRLREIIETGRENTTVLEDIYDFYGESYNTTDDIIYEFDEFYPQNDDTKPLFDSFEALNYDLIKPIEEQQDSPAEMKKKIAAEEAKDRAEAAGRAGQLNSIRQTENRQEIAGNLIARTRPQKKYEDLYEFLPGPADKSDEYLHTIIDARDFDVPYQPTLLGNQPAPAKNKKKYDALQARERTHIPHNRQSLIREQVQANRKLTLGLHQKARAFINGIDSHGEAEYWSLKARDHRNNGLGNLDTGNIGGESKTESIIDEFQNDPNFETSWENNRKPEEEETFVDRTDSVTVPFGANPLDFVGKDEDKETKLRSAFHGQLETSREESFRELTSEPKRRKSDSQGRKWNIIDKVVSNLGLELSPDARKNLVREFDRRLKINIPSQDLTQKYATKSETNNKAGTSETRPFDGNALADNLRRFLGSSKRVDPEPAGKPKGFLNVGLETEEEIDILELDPAQKQFINDYYHNLPLTDDKLRDYIINRPLNQDSRQKQVPVVDLHKSQREVQDIVKELLGRRTSQDNIKQLFSQNAPVNTKPPSLDPRPPASPIKGIDRGIRVKAPAILTAPPQSYPSSFSEDDKGDIIQAEFAVSNIVPSSNNQNAESLIKSLGDTINNRRNDAQTIIDQIKELIQERGRPANDELLPVHRNSENNLVTLKSAPIPRSPISFLEQPTAKPPIFVDQGIHALPSISQSVRSLGATDRGQWAGDIHDKIHTIPRNNDLAGNLFKLSSEYQSPNYVDITDEAGELVRYVASPINQANSRRNSLKTAEVDEIPHRIDSDYDFRDDEQGIQVTTKPIIRDEASEEGSESFTSFEQNFPQSGDVRDIPDYEGDSTENSVVIRSGQLQNCNFDHPWINDDFFSSDVIVYGKENENALREQRRKCLEKQQERLDEKSSESWDEWESKREEREKNEEIRRQRIQKERERREREEREKQDVEIEERNRVRQEKREKIERKIELEQKEEQRRERESDREDLKRLRKQERERKEEQARKIDYLLGKETSDTPILDDLSERLNEISGRRDPPRYLEIIKSQIEVFRNGGRRINAGNLPNGRRIPVRNYDRLFTTTNRPTTTASTTFPTTTTTTTERTTTKSSITTTEKSISHAIFVIPAIVPRNSNDRAIRVPSKSRNRRPNRRRNNQRSGLNTPRTETRPFHTEINSAGVIGSTYKQVDSREDIQYSAPSSEIFDGAFDRIGFPFGFQPFGNNNERKPPPNDPFAKEARRHRASRRRTDKWETTSPPYEPELVQRSAYNPPGPISAPAVSAPDFKPPALPTFSQRTQQKRPEPPPLNISPPSLSPFPPAQESYPLPPPAAPRSPSNYPGISYTQKPPSPGPYNEQDVFPQVKGYETLVAPPARTDSNSYQDQQNQQLPYKYSIPLPSPAKYPEVSQPYRQDQRSLSVVQLPPSRPAPGPVDLSKYPPIVRSHPLASAPAPPPARSLIQVPVPQQAFSDYYSYYSDPSLSAANSYSTVDPYSLILPPARRDAFSSPLIHQSNPWWSTGDGIVTSASTAANFYARGVQDIYEPQALAGLGSANDAQSLDNYLSTEWGLDPFLSADWISLDSGWYNRNRNKKTQKLRSKKLVARSKSRVAAAAKQKASRRARTQRQRQKAS